MTRRRTLDWALIAILTGIWGVLVVRAVDLGVRTERGFPPFTVSSASGDHGYPTSLARGAGPPTDRFESVDGVDLRGASALRFYDRVTRSARERGFAVIRGTRDGAPLELQLRLAPREGWWIPLVAQGLALLVAAALLVRAPSWHLARLNFVMFWAWASAMAALPW